MWKCTFYLIKIMVDMWILRGIYWYTFICRTVNPIKMYYFVKLYQSLHNTTQFVTSELKIVDFQCFLKNPCRSRNKFVRQNVWGSTLGVTQFFKCLSRSRICTQFEILHSVDFNVNFLRWYEYRFYLLLMREFHSELFLFWNQGKH